MIGTFAPPYLLVALTTLTFFLAALSPRYAPQHTRTLQAVSWLVFALFWANLIEFFFVTHNSAIEAALAAIAVPASIAIAYYSYTERFSFTYTTRAIPIMFLLYFPVTGLPTAEKFLIETVARQVEFILHTTGYTFEMLLADNGYRNKVLFITNEHRYITRIVLACTGIGSISIILGLIGAVDAPLKTKTIAAGVAVPTIWLLNLARITFIAAAHGRQWFDFHPSTVSWLGITDPNLVSYAIADRIISQSLSVFALVALVIVLIRVIPQLASLVNELLYPVLGYELDFSTLK